MATNRSHHTRFPYIRSFKTRSSDPELDFDFGSEFWKPLRTSFCRKNWVFSSSSFRYAPEFSVSDQTIKISKRCRLLRIGLGSCFSKNWFGCWQNNKNMPFYIFALIGCAQLTSNFSSSSCCSSGGKALSSRLKGLRFELHWTFDIFLYLSKEN